MATTHIFAVGRTIGGKLDIQLAPRQQLAICGGSSGCHCHAYVIGKDDANNRRPSDPLKHLSALCCVEQYLLGYRGEA